MAAEGEKNRVALLFTEIQRLTVSHHHPDQWGSISSGTIQRTNCE